MGVISALFEYDGWEDVGIAGLRMVGKPNFDPAQGLGVCHDMLEHFPGEDDSIRAELMAFGAIHAIRWSNGYLHYPNVGSSHWASKTFAEWISGDFVEAWRATDQEKLWPHDLPGCGLVRRLSADEGPIFDEFVRAAQLGCEDVLDALELEDGDDRIDEWRRSEFHESQALWMMHGYRRAQARFPYRTDEICSMFVRSIALIDRAIEEMGSEGVPFGTKVRVSFDQYAGSCVVSAPSVKMKL